MLCYHSHMDNLDAYYADLEDDRVCSSCEDIMEMIKDTEKDVKDMVELFYSPNKFDREKFESVLRNFCQNFCVPLPKGELQIAGK